jgi:hypothetical protein
MDTDITSYLIILLSSVSVGMMIGLLFRPGDEYHGPNSREQCKKIYYNKKSDKCYKFLVKPIDYPKPKTKWEKFIGRLEKI